MLGMLVGIVDTCFKSPLGSEKVLVVRNLVFWTWVIQRSAFLTW